MKPPARLPCTPSPPPRSASAGGAAGCVAPSERGHSAGASPACRTWPLAPASRSGRIPDARDGHLGTGILVLCSIGPDVLA
eukprot:7377457-Alexandrium_andersonii.AAC.1